MAVIVMTGATSGIGAIAAARMIAEGHRLIVGARTVADAPAGAEGVPLDLADLDSVRRFVAAVREHGPVDMLVLNAGVQTGAYRRSTQGHELTFAVNHLAHYLLTRLLLAEQTIPRVVVTASGVHDPAEGLRFPPPPTHADAARLADPSTDPARDKNARIAGARAYSASKLCNILFTRALAQHVPGIAAIAYDPAYVPGTGLGRDAPRVIVKLFEWCAPMFMAKDRISTVARSGEALARLATDPTLGTAGTAYWSMRGEPVPRAPSELARDDAVAERLWQDSAGLVGIAA